MSSISGALGDFPSGLLLISAAGGIAQSHRSSNPNSGVKTHGQEITVALNQAAGSPRQFKL
jgi:hypothetical protein